MKTKKKIKELERRIRDLELITGLRGTSVQTWDGNTCLITVTDDETCEIKEHKVSVR